MSGNPAVQKQVSHQSQADDGLPVENFAPGDEVEGLFEFYRLDFGDFIHVESNGGRGQAEGGVNPDDLTGITDGGMKRADGKEPRGLKPGFFRQFPVGAGFRVFAGIDFPGGNFQGFPTDGVTPLANHEDVFPIDERDDGGGFGMFDPDPFRDFAGPQANFVQCGAEMPGVQNAQCSDLFFHTAIRFCMFL